MTTKILIDKETVGLVLELFKECRRDPRLKYEHPTYENVIKALRQALAQPEQEPVEWYSVEGETRRYGVGMVECAYAIGRDEVVHVVTHESVKDVAMKHLPTQRKPLTDEQIESIAKNYALNNPTTPLYFASAIEAKLKEKNHV